MSSLLDVVKPETLASAEADYQRAIATAEASRRKRDRLIRNAVRAGMPQAEAARATGLTRGRVGQIIGRDD
jgi:hypothetical protein